MRDGEESFDRCLYAVGAHWGSVPFAGGKWSSLRLKICGKLNFVSVSGFPLERSLISKSCIENGFKVIEMTNFYIPDLANERWPTWKKQKKNKNKLELYDIAMHGYLSIYTLSFTYSCHIWKIYDVLKCVPKIMNGISIIDNRLIYVILRLDRYFAIIYFTRWCLTLSWGMNFGKTCQMIWFSSPSWRKAGKLPR